MGKIRVLQIGCGKMGKYTMRYVQEHGCELVGAVDRSKKIIGLDVSDIMEVNVPTGVSVRFS